MFDYRVCFMPVRSDEQYDCLESDIDAINSVLSSVNMHVFTFVAGISVIEYHARIPAMANVSKILKLAPNLSIAMQDDNLKVYRRKDLLVIEKYIGGRRISMYEMINDRFNNSDGLTIILGKDAQGNNVYTDLAKAPHMLVAGMTGSGKSVFLHNVIISLIARTDAQILMIDPKMSEYQMYHKRIPQFYLYTDNDVALSILQDVCDEMDARYADFAKMGYRDFNDAKAHGYDGKPIVVMIDEYADLMSATKNKCDPLCVRIAQKARAAGIHLVIATQYPIVKFVSSGIKANIPVRVAFRVQNGTESRVILDRMGAEKLAGKGDMLFLGNGAIDTIRIKTPYATNDDINIFTGKHLLNDREQNPNVCRNDWRRPRPNTTQQEVTKTNDDIPSIRVRMMMGMSIEEATYTYNRDMDAQLKRRLGLS